MFTNFPGQLELPQIHDFARDSPQGLDRWKRQLVSVLRDGHALLTTLNEGAALSGSIVT